VTRIDRYIFGQLASLFGFFALVLVAMYWVNRAVRLFDQIISDGQSAWVFLELTVLTLPTVIRVMLPVAAFVASVYVANRLSSESELAVMQATGSDPWRLLRAVAIFGAAVALMTGVLTNYLEPLSRRALAERQSEISADVAAKFLTEGTFLHPAAGVTLFIRRMEPDGALRDVFLADARDPARETIYTARRAAFVEGEAGPRLVMFEGTAQSLRAPGRTLALTRFEDFTYDIGALIATRDDIPIRPEYLSTAELVRAGPEAEAVTGAPRATLLTEGHERIAQPLFALSAAVIGFAALLVGGYSRFGLWPRIALATGIGIVVQLLANYGSNLSRGGEHLWPAVYLPVAAGLAAAAALVWLAARARAVPSEPLGRSVPA
jgi:lipopolysaccharide export system permease protein